eukprot:TRINITY_DN17662_c0_g1_i11.p4 TRINITY_DN17662_c0_g1~~TRINITY_DN17662_c0_g1_i11.p4  ORF type:complete len:113 (-),score=7.42 TRINITY_DN17662_c0_g1_i11:92-430(-)
MCSASFLRNSVASVCFGSSGRETGSSLEPTEFPDDSECKAPSRRRAFHAGCQFGLVAICNGGENLWRQFVTLNMVTQELGSYASCFGRFCCYLVRLRVLQWSISAASVQDVA